MRTKFINLTSSGVVIGGEGVLDGFYVNSTSTGVIRLYHSASGTSETTVKPIGGFITPAIGYHCLSGLHATVGVYCGVPSGTINVTFFVRESNE